MSIDVRRGHGRRARELAADLFERGRGHESAARGLGIPAGAVRKWMCTYRSVGREGLPAMGRERPRYGLETKLAAARAVVEDGMPRAAAMERHGVASASSLDRWRRTHREGGEGVPRPQPKGSGAKPRRRRARRSSGARSGGSRRM